MSIFACTCNQMDAPGGTSVNILRGGVVKWTPREAKMTIFPWTCDQMGAPGEAEKAEPGLALAGGRAGGPPPRELRVSRPVARGTIAGCWCAGQAYDII